jgi:hypothetical protein
VVGEGAVGEGVVGEGVVGEGVPVGVGVETVEGSGGNVICAGELKAAGNNRDRLEVCHAYFEAVGGPYVRFDGPECLR